MPALLALTLVLGAGAPTPLRYPLDCPPQVTSTFGTYRIGHHHAGLDLATHEREDVHVLAAMEGEVIRIRRSHVGYGRSLYLRHPDGRQTVYGHLSALSPPLDALLRAEEEKRHRYELAFDLDPPVKVKAGEVLGFAGTSGTDLLHLHFELREDGFPVNPLTRGLKLTDTQAPVFGRLKLVPRDAAAHVGQAADEVLQPLPATEPLVIGGRVGLLVEVADHLDGSERGLTPYTLELWIDGVLRHAKRFDTSSYGDHNPTELDFDARAKAEDVGTFYKLYQEGPRTRVQRPGVKGLEALPPGDHAVELRAGDAAGHLTRATFTLRVVPAEAPCAFERAPALPEGADSALPTGRIWRENTVFLPMPEACAAGAPKLLITRDGKPLATGWRLTRLAGAPAVALDVTTEADAVYRIGLARGAEAPTWFRLETKAMRAGAVLTRADEAVKLTVGKDALFFPYPTELTEAPNPGGPGLEALSPLYVFAQTWRPTRADSRVSLRAPADLTAAAIYFNERGRWWPVGPASGANLVHLGGLAVMRDVSPPMLGTVDRRPHPAGQVIVAQISDQGSGVKQVQMWVDGRVVYPEWMSAYSEAVWRPWTPLKKGDHEVRVRVTDRAGLSAESLSTVGW